jgi:WD40 repeat protein
LLAGFVDGSLVLWDIKNARNAFGARHMNAPIERVEYSKNSEYLLIQRGEEVEVRLTSNGNLLYRFNAVDFAVSPIGSLAAFGEADGTVRIRNLETGKGIREIKAHEDRIYSLAFSPDGNYLASSGRDCDIKLWDVNTGKLLHYFEETTVDAYEIDEPSRIFSTYLKFIPNKNMVVGFGSWGTVVNWNVNSGATNYVIQSEALQYYNGMITIKPHFPEFFTVDDPNNRFYINENGFDLTTGEGLGAYQAPANLPEGCAPVGPKSIDQKLLFTLGVETHDGEICVLNAETMELLDLVLVPWANWLYLSPDGKQLIVTAGSGIVYVIQVV